MSTDAKKLLNQKNYILKRKKKKTEMGIEEIQKELQEDQRSHINGIEGEELQQFCTMNAGQQKQILAPTEEEMENHQQRDDISKLKENIKSAYYQVTKIEINNTTRLQKLQSTFKVTEKVKNANEARAEILSNKDLNLTEINYLIYVAATVFTEEINRTGCYKSETHSPKTHPWVRHIQENINGIREDLSASAEIKRDEMKKQDMKRNRLLRKSNIKEGENLD